MKERKGFTIVELLVVLVIIGILCAVYFPQLIEIYKRFKG